MALSFRKFWEGIRIVAKAATSSTTKGDLEVLDPDSKIYYHNGTVNSPLLTEAGTATVENKTFVVANNTFTTVAAGNLTATELNAALAELDADTSAAAGDLAAHIADAVGAHAATAISFAPTGTLSSIEVQAALAELDGDIQAHITDAVGAHAASAISNIPSGNLSAIEVQAALNELQSDIDTRGVAITALDEGVTLTAAMSSINFVGTSVTATNIGNAVTVTVVGGGDVTGPASAVDNHLVRFDGTTGKLIQDGSTAVLGDAGALSGLTQLDVDNLRLDGNTISSTDANGNIILAPNGTGEVNVTKNAQFDALIDFASTNDAASGANATLTSPTTKVIRLTNAGLISLDGIPGGTSARELIIENATGTTVVINEDTGGTAANRFYTGTTTGINLADKASLYLSYDATQSRWRVIGGSGSGTGGDSGCFAELDATELLSTWSTGDNATFLGGGTLSGTFVKETTSPLNGTASYKYTQAAGSLDDYLASPIQEVPLRFRGSVATWTFVYRYDGGSSDIEPIVYDVTNSTKLTASTNLLPFTGPNSSIYRANINIPSTTTQIRVGFQTKILNSGKILQFDDLMICSDTTVYADPSTVTQWTDFPSVAAGTLITAVTTSPTYGTVVINKAQWRRVGSNMEIVWNYRQSTAGTAGSGMYLFNLPAGYQIDTTKTTASTSSAQQNSDGTVGKWWATANIQGFTGIGEVSVYDATRLKVSDSITSSNTGSNTTQVWNSANPFHFAYSSPITYSMVMSVPIRGWQANNPMIVTASESFSTDTGSLVYASSAQYTQTTLANAPIGTFITFTYAASTNTRTQTTTAPTQTTADMNTNGIQIFSRAYNAASTAASPAAVAVQIGKGLKGSALTLYKSAGKVLSGSLDSVNDAGSTEYGILMKEYDETTGIFYIDAGVKSRTAVTSHLFLFDDITTQTSGYAVINASFSPALVGVPQVQPRFATISDVKASGTDGGTASTGVFQTRVLNTLSDPTSIVTSLVSNQFILPAGTYYIEACVPGYRILLHKAKLRNITDSTDDLIGSSESSNNGAGTLTSTHSWIRGEIVLTGSKTFEIQHRNNATTGTNDLGVPTSVGISEVYTTVKITKTK